MPARQDAHANAAATGSPARPARAKRTPSGAQRSASRKRAALRRQPRLSRLLAWLLSAVLGTAGLAYAQVPAGALPIGGQVVVGAGQLQQRPNLLIVNQSTQRLGMDWQSFNIGSGAAVEFRQPSASSVALNRVVGHSGTEIYGQMRANGQVFLTNPHGVLFAPGSKVDVGGLVASTLDMSQQDFADSRYIFNATGVAGTVSNQGSLRASAGGYLALFGQQVDNRGDVSVDAGAVVLASGRAATVSISGSGLISAVVTAGASGSVSNSGSLRADGGTVTLTAHSAQAIAESLVNNTGIVRANTLVERQGEIWITGDQVVSTGRISADATGTADAGRVSIKGGMDNGSLLAGGSITAGAEQGAGGQVETSAAHVQIAADMRVTTLSRAGRHGTWLIDPTDFTVAAGAGALTSSGIGASTLSANLNGGNVSLLTAITGSEPGDIFVQAPVSWSASTTLTLTASRNVDVNANITTSGDAAGLVITPGTGGSFNMGSAAKIALPGPNSSLEIAGVSYAMVRNLAELRALDGSASVLAGNYALANDIDAGATASASFNPIGNEATTTIGTANSFGGRFQGLGNSISGLTIDAPTSNATGLFATTSGARIDNLVLVGGSVVGSHVVGSLIGSAGGATVVNNARSSATISAVDDSSSGVYAGGLIGFTGTSAAIAINRSSATGSVAADTNTATARVGGLIGEQGGGTMSNVSASGDVTATLRSGTNASGHYVGGLVGESNASSIILATASGNVSGLRDTGGLVGRFQPAGTGGGSISNSSASGNVSSGNDAGGLVGTAIGTGAITNSSATGTVTSTGSTTASSAGGAVGWYNLSLAPVGLSASGNVSGGGHAGGLVGYYQSNAALAAGSLVDVVPGGTTKTVTGALFAGGLIGYSTSTGAIAGLTAAANVTATTTAGTAGGLIGRSAGPVGTSSASGAVVGGSDVGGLVGTAIGAGGFADVSASGSATGSGTSSRTGGLVGYYNNSGALLRTSAIGAVTSANVGGGLIGTFSSAGGIQDASTAVTSTVTAGGYAGGLVGDAAGTGTSSITDSTARGAVTSSSTSAYVGGLVGDFTMAGGMARVTASGDVSGGGRTGGLVGSYGTAGTLVTASSTATAVSGNNHVGGLIGYHNGGAVSGVSAVAAVTGTNTTGASTVGGLIGRVGGAVSSATASGNVTSNSTSGAVAGGLIGTADGTGAVTDGSASGTVTSASTTTSYVGGLIGYISSGSVVRGTATGDVSGGNYTGGLIGYFTNGSGAVIQTADARGDVSGRGDVGGIVGYANGNGSMSGSTAIGQVTSSATTGFSAGGAAGYFNLTGGMTGITVTGNVAGSYYAGGVVGYYDPTAAFGTVSSTAATVRGSTYAGGIVGYSDASSITGLTSAADVTTTNAGGAAGGLAGRTAGAVSASSATGSVTAAGDAGGLIGEALGTGALSTLLASGNVTSTATSGYVGGLIGRVTSGSLSDSTATGHVSGGNHAGGLVGQFNVIGNITNSGASGNVTASVSSYIGGLVGYALGAGLFDGVTATGNVTSTHPTSYTGGLVGQFSKAGGLTNATAGGTVSGGQRVGGLVGYYASGGNLSNASAVGAVTGGTYVGGLVGDFVSSGTLTNATASGAVRGDSFVGGMVGSYNSSGAASTLLATGNVTASGAYAGGLFGIWQYSGTLVDSRATGQVSGGGYTGGLVGYGYSNGTLTNSSAAGNVFGTTYVGGLAGQLYFTPISLATATGNVTGASESTVYAGGLVGYFYVSAAGTGISNSTASGSVFADAGGTRVGGLVGEMAGGNIVASSATGNASGRNSISGSSSGHYVGGLVGNFNTGVITDSSASGDVSGGYYAGGLVGYYYGPTTMANVSASGDVSGTQYVGGLVGNLVYSGVTNGFASGDVVSTSGGYAGGLVGYGQSYTAVSTASIVDSRALGNVSGGSVSGGLVGYWDDYFASTGSTAITLSRASGNVSAATTAGGLVGFYNASSSSTTSGGIRSSYATGNVTAPITVGGLVGQFGGYAGIQDSYATGNVVGTGSTTAQYLGGLVGRYLNYSSTAGTGQLLRSYASGNVSLASTATLGSFTDVYAGGLVGYLDGPSTSFVTAADIYATGAVSLINASGRLRAGGLVGFTDTSIARTYATGAVTATLSSPSSVASGLVAQRSSTAVTATSSYWATDTTGQASSIIGTASTLADMQNAATFSGWDLASTGGTTQAWRIYEGQTTPLLRGLLTPLTLTLADISKVYDGTTSLGDAAISVGGVTVSNPERIFVSGVSANAGSHALTASNLYSVQNGYDLSLTGSATLTIGRRTLTLEGLVNDKVYDGTTAATLAVTPQFGGLVPGDDLVLLPGTGFGVAFATKTAGVDKAVNISGSYAIGNGTVGLAANYIAPTALTTSADISQAELNAGSFSAASRIYDGTTTVAVTATSATLTGVVAGDSVTVDLSTVSSGTMANKNVGTGKAVTVAGASLTGADASNYRLAGVDAVMVDITPKALTINGIAGNDRQYNTGTTVGLNTSAISLSGLVTGDEVQPRLSGLSGSIADKNVGSSRPVTVTGLALRGLDAANYMPLAGAVTVTIDPYLLTLYLGRTGTTDRVYDGTTTANVNFPTYWYGGDDITVSNTSVGYADKNVAYTSGGAVTSKVITATGISISGADAGNYALQNTTTTTTGTISPRPLSVSGVSAVDRVYDSTRDVTVNISGATVDTSVIVIGDVVSVATPGSGSVMGQVANKNVGTNKAVTVPGLTLTGTDAGNYSITSGSGGGVTVDITRKDLTAVYTAVNKVYDGDVFAPMNVTSADILAGDSINFYIDRSYCGDNACGYAVFTDAGRLGDGSYTTSRHVGTAKPVVITYNQLVGADAGNYNLLNITGTASADITPKPVTLAYSGVSKVYDGTTVASVSLNYGASGLFGGDTLTSTQTAIYTGTNAKNVGTGKPISVSDIVLSGTHAGNYTVGNATATSSGTVTAKPITVSGITATDRAYDGTTAVAVTAGTVTSSGFVAGDAVAVDLPPAGLTTGTIANKNVGTAKPVTVTGLTLSGTDAINYSIDPTGSGITVNILQAALTPTFSGVSRVYNGGVSATVTSTTAGIFGSDVVTFSQSAVYTGAGARNVGTAKPVSVTGISIGGSGAANYSLASTTASANADITPKPVTATYVGASRVYNGVADVSAAVVGSSLQFVAGDTVGLGQTARFTGDGSAGTGKAVSIADIVLTGVHATNYSLVNTTASTTASITPRLLGVTGISATNRAYDGTTTVAVNVAGATVDTSAVIAGDDVSVTLPPSGISSGDMLDRHAGNNKPVSITGLTISGASAANYAAIGATGLTVSISPLSLTASYVGVDKVYDGNAEAIVTATSTDILPIDSASLFFSASGLFTGGKNVGTGKLLDVSGAFLTGAARDNYVISNTSGSTTANITPRTVTADYSGSSRVYDGTVGALVTSSLSNRVAGDSLSATQTAEFTGSGARNVGTGKPISVTGIALAGADAGNFVLATTTDTTTGSVTPKPITVSGLTSVVATDRVYDGTSDVTVTVPTGVTLVPDSSDIVAGDVVSIAVPPSGVTSGTVANKNVGAGKAVTVDGLTLSGTDAGNYLIAGTAGITVSITPKLLTAVYSGVNKVYDGSILANATGTSLDIVSGDTVLIRGNGSFTGTGAKNVGTGKAVVITSGTLSSTDAANYSLVNGTGSTTADITPRAITPTYAGGSRVYDGGTAAPVTGSASGFVVGDSVTLSETAVFSGAGSRNAGIGKPITISGISLSGGDAFNYSLTTTGASTTGTITPKALTLIGLTGVSASDRIYDGTLSVSVNISGTGTIGIDTADIVAGDDVGIVAPSVGATTGTLLSKNVGNNKPLTVDGLGLTGAHAANYTVTAASGLTVNITPKSLSASYTGVDKIYDGSNAASVLGSSADIVTGDTVSITGSGIFSSGKNVGTGLAIAVTAGSMGGIDAGNYTLLTTTGSATANITPRFLTAGYVGGTRIYDGTTAAPVTGSMAGLISGDTVSLSQTATFAGSGAKNVGTNKTVDVSGISLAGSDASNYSLGATTASTTASVTPRPLGIVGLTGVTATDREYDGTRDVLVNVSTTGVVTPDSADLIAGDDVSVTAPPTGLSTGTMADKHVGTLKPVAVAGLTLGGADAGNYSVTNTSGVTVNITPRTLNASYAGVSRVYDGTTAATALGTSGDIVAGDSVLITGRGLFTGAGARNAGLNKPIEITSATLSSADAGNYVLASTTASTTADIAPRSVSNSYAGGTRVYDGSIAAPVTRTTTGLLTGDAVNVAESSTFSEAGGKNVGSGKAVLISGITLSGDDAINYALTATSATTTGGITPRPLNVTGLSGITAVDRVYDGTLAVEVLVSGTAGTASGDVIAGDAVTVNVPGSGLGGGLMVDKHAGSIKPVVLSGLFLSGADAPNYAITGTAGVTVNIAPRSVSLSGVNAVDRVYDGTTLVAINTTGGTITGALAGDDLSLLASGSTANMADKHAGLAKPVDFAGLTLGGADAGNYIATGGAGLTVNISPRTLTPTVTASDRVYDGTTNASVVLTDNRVAGDVLSLSAGAASYADRNAGTVIAIAVSGLALAGADAGNYLLGATSLLTAANINRAPLTVTADNLNRVFGESLAISGSEFNAAGLVAGETLGAVSLASAGAAALAPVAGSPYSVTVGGATGGSFNPANYDLSYVNGQLLVTPRPLTIASNSLVRFADETNPTTFGFSTSVGGLAGGDSIASVVQLPPAGSATAPGGSVYELLPSGAIFASGFAGNYSLSYASGLLVVLPKPPRIGDTDAGSSGGGDVNFAIQVDEAEVRRALAELNRATAATANTAAPSTGTPTAARALGTATPEEITIMLAGDGRRINLPALQKMPLISFDPQLRRLIFAGDTATAP